MDRTVFANREVVAFPDFGIEPVAAKVDTGAWSGALHATNIRQADGKLIFWPLGLEAHEVTVENYELRSVRSSNGVVQQRWLVPVTIEIRSLTYHTTITLADREKMKYKMLIGRKFLEDNQILVDVASEESQEYEIEDES